METLLINSPPSSLIRFPSLNKSTHRDSSPISSSLSKRQKKKPSSRKLVPHDSSSTCESVASNDCKLSQNLPLPPLTLPLKIRDLGTYPVSTDRNVLARRSHNNQNMHAHDILQPARQLCESIKRRGGSITSRNSNVFKTQCPYDENAAATLGKENFRPLANNLNTLESHTVKVERKKIDPLLKCKVVRVKYGEQPRKSSTQHKNTHPEENKQYSDKIQENGREIQDCDGMSEIGKGIESQTDIQEIFEELGWA